MTWCDVIHQRGDGGHPPCHDHVTSRGTNSEGYKTRRSGVVLVRCFDGLVVKTSRCGREDPGSNPGRGSFFFFTLFGKIVFSLVSPTR